MEVAVEFPGTVPVRDSKTPHGPSVCFSGGSWAVFIGELKSGRHRI